jgi:hypothetical protein
MISKSIDGDGVREYTDGVAAVPVHFPKNKETCQWCEYCYAEPELKRFKCRLTRELIEFPFTERGVMCPIMFGEETLDSDNSTVL